MRNSKEAAIPALRLFKALASETRLQVLESQQVTGSTGRNISRRRYVDLLEDRLFA